MAFHLKVKEKRQKKVDFHLNLTEKKHKRVDFHFTKERKTVTRVGRGWWFELGLVGWLSVPSTAETVAPSLPPYPPYQNCSQAMREAWVPDPTETKQQSGRVEKPAETFDEYCNLASAKAVYADGFLLQALATKLQTTDTIIWKYANGAWDRCN